MIFSALRRWRRQRLLERLAIPDALWAEALSALPFLSLYGSAEIARLRELATLFLHEKSIVGAHAFEVTPLMRTVIAVQACLPILNLGLEWYRGWENVVVYPGEFLPRHHYEDEAGVVHESDDPMAGEAMHGGPVALSWPDALAGGDWHATGMNLVIHEFAHKLDMLRGEADGLPPLHATMSVRAWSEALGAAYEDFCARVDAGEDTAIDPYAAEHASEFFAVLAEVFFAEPGLLREEYPAVYEQFGLFFRIEPGAGRETPSA